ncbi:hypothetical protein MSKU9_0364 [Komagataeibacter diospyri]|uniref:Uncharacterized protein n=1 Tax=Komagataeibacter diospyri TaxID=1932662 RepID=A0A4P5NLI4_9PROT|nr:hypothetical protein MSKU9_0364 [Komagataeibacter diospyri]
MQEESFLQYLINIFQNLQRFSPVAIGVGLVAGRIFVTVQMIFEGTVILRDQVMPDIEQPVLRVMLSQHMISRLSSTTV